MYGWRRGRELFLLAVLCVAVAGCGTAARCLPQPLEVIASPVRVSQVERSVAMVSNCVLPAVGCRQGTAFPIGGDYWLTAASLARNPAASLVPRAPRWSLVTISIGGHRYRARPVRVAPAQGYLLLQIPGTSSARGLPLDARSPQPLDAATVVCAEPARAVAHSGSLFLPTPPAPDANLFEVDTAAAASHCAGGPVLDGGLVVGMQLFGGPGGAWAAPTFAMTRLPSMSTAACDS